MTEQQRTWMFATKVFGVPTPLEDAEFIMPCGPGTKIARFGRLLVIVGPEHPPVFIDVEEAPCAEPS